MKKLVGIIGICCLITSAAFVSGGCGNSKEGDPPADVNKDVTPGDVKGGGSKQQPGGAQPMQLKAGGTTTTGK